MVGGYMGKLLQVDLTNRRVKDIVLSKELARELIGGVGIGARLLIEGVSMETDPLGENNVLMFLTGPLTNTKVPTSGRYSVVCKSPLGNWGEADSGGHFGPALKSSGYDGVVITGKSASPVYIHLNDGKAFIRDAEHLWGKDTYETDELLKKEIPDKIVTAVIGPAGEQMAKIACILNDGKYGRVAGRGGLGAVMGSKKLKAIVAHGKMKPPIVAGDRLDEHIKKMVALLREWTPGLQKFGTAGGVLRNYKIGDLPVKNFKWGEWKIEEIEKISGEKMAESILKRRFYCGSCPIGCGRIVQIDKGPYAGGEMSGPEYESLGAFGSLLLISDLEAITFAHELCNRYGMDVISAGCAIAFVMEAFEEGLLAKTDTDGIELRWGNPSAMIEMLHRIGRREGFGYILGEGVRFASQTIGEASKAFCMEVKGLELPMHDPRALGSFAVSYATCPRGACHRGNSQFLERFPISELGVEAPLERQEDKGKGIIAAKMEDLSALLNSLKLCSFIIPAGMKPSDVLACLNYVTGWDVDLKEFLLIGERITNIKKLFNLKMGLSRKDDNLPSRIKFMKLDSGGAKNYVPDLSLMLMEYYAYRGWDDNGIPKDQTLERLNLDGLRVS